MQKALRTRRESERCREPLSLEEALRLIDAAATGRQAERNRLLLQAIFVGRLRPLQALSLTPENVNTLVNGELAGELHRYAKKHRSQKLFKITRQRVWQIVSIAAKRAKLGQGINLPFCIRVA
jgi:hypothetical protein